MGVGRRGRTRASSGAGKAAGPGRDSFAGAHRGGRHAQQRQRARAHGCAARPSPSSESRAAQGTNVGGRAHQRRGLLMSSRAEAARKCRLRGPAAEGSEQPRCEIAETDQEACARCMHDLISAGLICLERDGRATSESPAGGRRAARPRAGLQAAGRQLLSWRASRAVAPLLSQRYSAHKIAGAHLLLADSLTWCTPCPLRGCMGGAETDVPCSTRGC